MCSFLWITWSKLIIFENTYIWIVCSFKRKSHVIKMNIWLYRHWHFFENEKIFSCFIKSLYSEISSVAWNFNLIYNILIFNSFSSSMIFFLFFDSIHSFFYLSHINDRSAVLWSLNLKKKVKNNWKIEKSIVNEMKWNRILIRLMHEMFVRNDRLK